MKLGKIFKKSKKDPKDKRGRDPDDRGAGSTGEDLDPETLRAISADSEQRAAETAALQDALAQSLPEGLDIGTRFMAEEGDLYYLVKINNNTEDIMGDVKVAISPEDSIITCRKPRKTAKFIDPGKSKIFKFSLQPNMKCGRSTIQGLFRYFDFNEKEPREYYIPEYELSISCPDIIGKDVEEEHWRITMSKLESYEIETAEMDFEPQKIFNHFSKIAGKLGFRPFKPVIVPTLYRGIGKFFGLDMLKDPYCVEIQVIGKGKKSRLLMRVWAPSYTQAMGVSFRFLGKADKRLKIKTKISSKKSR
jgi:hypothetical protein